MGDLFQDFEEALERHINKQWKKDELEMFPFLEERHFEVIGL